MTMVAHVFRKTHNLRVWIGPVLVLFRCPHCTKAAEEVHLGTRLRTSMNHKANVAMRWTAGLDPPQEFGLSQNDAWLGLAWLSLAWLGLACLWPVLDCHSLAWLGWAWHNWLGFAWLGLAWLGLPWLAVPCLGLAQLGVRRPVVRI